MQIKPGFLLRRIIDRWVVVPLEKDAQATGRTLCLNESSALLWEALEQGSDASALTSLLCEKYIVDPETAGRDVKRFLDALREAGVLVEE